MQLEVMNNYGLQQSSASRYLTLETYNTYDMCMSFCLWIFVLAIPKDGYGLVTLHTQFDFIVMPHWEIRPLAQ